MKYILFPLGNPGLKYVNTRHNAGRLVLAKLLEDLDFQNFLEVKQIAVFIPEDFFMNESGVALHKYLKNKNIETKNIIILYDDKDLEIGEVKLSFGNSAGGHKGIENLMAELGSPDFQRIRLGIAPKGTGHDGKIPPHGEEVSEYVLENFTKVEKAELLGSEVLDKVKFSLQKITTEEK